MNALLILITSPEEITSIVFSMNKHGALGFDENNVYFFQTYKDIMCKGVRDVVTQLFIHSWIFRNINASTLVLIPKTKNVD